LAGGKWDCFWKGVGGQSAQMSDLDLGVQPLDRMMEAYGLSNTHVVDSSPEQLTHKQVQRARKGRRLTLKMMQKVTETLNVTIWACLREVHLLFTTDGHR